MFTTLFLRTIIIGIVLIMPLTAAAADQGFYLGISGGEARMDKKDLFWNLSVDTWPASLVPDYDLSGTVMKVYGGYAFNKNLAIEGAYGSLTGIEINVTDTAGPGSAKIEFEGTTFLVAGVGTIPFDNGIMLFSKLGMARTKGEVTCTGSGTLANCGNDISGTNEEWDPMLGFGIGYSFTKSLAARFEWEQIRDSREGGSIGVEFTTVGVQYAF